MLQLGLRHTFKLIPGPGCHPVCNSTRSRSRTCTDTLWNGSAVRAYHVIERKVECEI
ncbi:hypothetical protein K443DRAFT_260064 [Laccaria amethystina LaAM-08-1]|uniref:Uncharacterized protein n=1 Tax=Laccaria amethystina LaAM-08-1 TaxID=1095629 RepID=A0A0C9WWQ7_9AGAR|nr:hypothetical protein K443DRAFT_260064 [Laccaria amethystina LaAM-08-1]